MLHYIGGWETVDITGPVVGGCTKSNTNFVAGKNGDCMQMANGYVEICSGSSSSSNNCFSCSAQEDFRFCDSCRSTRPVVFFESIRVPRAIGSQSDQLLGRVCNSVICRRRLGPGSNLVTIASAGGRWCTVSILVVIALTRRRELLLVVMDIQDGCFA